MPALAENQGAASADTLLRQGLVALEERRYKEAISMFQAAIDEDKMKGSAATVKMKCLSYMGLALTLSQGRSEDGLRLCQEAVRREFFDADLYCNLAIVALRNRRRGLAFQAFRKGLALKPNHRRIHSELSKVERRGKLVFPFLSRSHGLNRIGGRLRWWTFQMFSRTNDNDR